MSGSQGVYVSSLTTDEWEPDPDVPGEMHLLCSADGVEAGLSRVDGAPGPISYTPPTRETLIVLEGRARIEIADGPSLDLGPGDIASLPGGVATTWFLTTPFREFWVFAGSAD